jgi:hypothetical protein
MMDDGITPYFGLDLARTLANVIADQGGLLEAAQAGTLLFLHHKAAWNAFRKALAARGLGNRSPLRQMCLAK